MTWLRNVYEQLDEFLAALLGFSPGTTISLNAAEAQVRRRVWGCVLCAWLHWTLRWSCVPHTASPRRRRRSENWWNR